MIKKILKQEKGGIALILSFLILSSILIISLTVANLSMQQSELSRQAEESIGAYQAADSGIEYFLYLVHERLVETRQDLFAETVLGTDDQFCSEANTYWFEVSSDSGSSYCLGPVFDDDTIIGMRTIGEYNSKTRRAVEIRGE